MANEGNIILEVKNLKKYFTVGNKDILKAVDNVSFAIKEGETLGLVGESGCGKTTCGRTVIGMYDKTDGEVLYKGKPVHGLKGKAKRDKRSSNYFPGSICFFKSKNDSCRYYCRRY